MSGSRNQLEKTRGTSRRNQARNRRDEKRIANRTERRRAKEDPENASTKRRYRGYQ